jgi:prolyl-tRNA editing enzyme YbaK/EbsC (Cys-tRNA(Pro) deacylase)
MSKTNTFPESTKRVQLALQKAGLAITVRQVQASTRTAEEAATAIGCGVGQIVKSMVFRGCESGRAYLILVSGANQVDENRCSLLLGERIERATPDFVREKTGFAIGGVAPLGHLSQIPTWMDQALLRFETLWAAAGSRAVFSITPRDLAQITFASLIELKSQAQQ